MSDDYITDLASTAHNITEHGDVLPVVGFAHMDDGTEADYDLLGGIHASYIRSLPERLLAFFSLLENEYSGYQISRAAHGLQSATRALRDGADDEMVLTALLHDIGDVLSPHSHGAFIAAILRPYVREECVWVVDKHPVFQYTYYGEFVGVDPNLKQRYDGHEHYAACEHFCRVYDQTSFDPDYQTHDLAYFAPLVRRIFAEPRYL